uniref:Uncharacterized protein n=1 Tax=viral metagenome TaxID=1070528 RepID=A0A6M3Y047_9ZZZZ
MSISLDDLDKAYEDLVEADNLLMTDVDKDLQEAKELLVHADTIMNSLYVAIFNYIKPVQWWSFTSINKRWRFHHLKDRIARWQDDFYNTDLISPSQSASPSAAPEEEGEE